MTDRRGPIAGVSALALALGLIAGAGGLTPLHVGRPAAIAADATPGATPVSGLQDVPDVGRTPETATLVASGATVRSILDPNRGLDRWFAIDLSAGDSLSVAVDAAAPGTVAATDSAGSPEASFDTGRGRARRGRPSTATGGTWSATGARPGRRRARYALTFLVTPSPMPRGTLPPGGRARLRRAGSSRKHRDRRSRHSRLPGCDRRRRQLSGTHPEGRVRARARVG